MGRCTRCRHGKRRSPNPPYRPSPRHEPITLAPATNPTPDRSPTYEAAGFSHPAAFRFCKSLGRPLSYSAGRSAMEKGPRAAAPHHQNGLASSSSANAFVAAAIVVSSRAFASRQQSGGEGTLGAHPPAVRTECSDDMLVHRDIVEIAESMLLRLQRREEFLALL